MRAIDQRQSPLNRVCYSQFPRGGGPCGAEPYRVAPSGGRGSKEKTWAGAFIVVSLGLNG